MSEDAKTTMQPLDEMSFRQAMAELDAIVGKLESNTMELEDSLEAYERGVKLLRELRLRLSSAQQKVSVLMGELEESVSDEVLESTLQKA
jgi:exodeoxyribonuclease VII small subunit